MLHSKSIQTNNNYLQLEPINYGELVRKYVSLVKRDINEKVNYSLYVDLCRYLHHSKIIDAKVDKQTLWLNQHFFMQEYNLAKALTSELQSRSLAPTYNTYHASEIAQLIVAANFSLTTKQLKTMHHIILDIYQIINDHVSFSIDEKRLSVHSFIEHIKYLAYRIIHRIDAHSDMSELATCYKEQFPKAATCSANIAAHIREHYDFHLCESEQLFLLFHIQKLANIQSND
ncbi:MULTISPECIES: PRD domain-containing protein [unclassified Breznakia]|uniref:PRD domain-containing protein n=1 Tax=unclassified Breznakia TaxID=2623764 RepID=UPI0024744950|nr:MULTISPECIES: PRD domain-containing protein [unclassified Breznakia]MDH6366616.1 hypothetical protein [Breznakia sp. PH1-1]MDH6403709.1 hypothetical protein [Breznakia sp. PF1-11]MDH6411418.1 hypothetical protein [Breznakia sp. PFB1-11]MDH6413851.1 hypothetical protein [Breznakia sp. PFB1-14]MDH6416281.1 hypothetical protein [Breznakia sp. PFB1-4]